MQKCIQSRWHAPTLPPSDDTPASQWPAPEASRQQATHHVLRRRHAVVRLAKQLPSLLLVHAPHLWLLQDDLQPGHRRSSWV
jgi:hypothetical protein